MSPAAAPAAAAPAVATANAPAAAAAPVAAPAAAPVQQPGVGGTEQSLPASSAAFNAGAVAVCCSCLAIVYTIVEAASLEPAPDSDPALQLFTP